MQFMALVHIPHNRHFSDDLIVVYYKETQRNISERVFAESARMVFRLSFIRGVALIATVFYRWC